MRKGHLSGDRVYQALTAERRKVIGTGPATTLIIRKNKDPIR
jgi:hypothetical protein